MGIIKILPAHEAHKIAAGEVIERPVHALKELLENSIDAGSDSIIINVSDGGKRLISVTDNGIGIAPDDLPLAIARHATSKITELNDLASLITHGFRGEALASIAAISKLTISSRQQNMVEAYQLTASEGSVFSLSPVSGPVGTTISVENIFDTVPVRRAFLKSRESEFRLLAQMIIPYALIHPTKSFKLIHEGASIAHYPAVLTLRDRYAQIVGREIIKSYMPINITTPDGTLNGGIIRPNEKRRDRSGIIIAVNNRPIKSARLASACIRGYGQLLDIGSYPLCFINITVDPTTIDVNVHPRKEDILFLSPRIIEDLISRTIRKTIEQREQHTIVIQNRGIEDSAAPPIKQSFIIEQPEISTIVDIPDYRIIGQYATTYILLEKQDGLLIIDQHAAHERILYEQLQAKLHHATATTLLFPEKIELTHKEVAEISTQLQLLEELGIALEQIGPSTMIARTTPLIYKGTVSDIIRELLAALLEERSAPDELRAYLSHRARAMMACKAAVKAGDTLSHSEMHSIVETLYRTDHFKTCPHGRPTEWSLERASVERIFKRR